MHEGRIVQVGDGESLYRHPAHPFVATFLGRVNVLRRNEQSLLNNEVELADLSLSCPDALRGAQELLVRPEDIGVCMNTQPGWARASVKQRSFLGGRVQLTLDVDGQAALIAEVDRDHPAIVGSSVGIHIPPSALMPGTVAPS